MSTTATGKRYERELVNEFESRFTWTVERVSGSGGFQGTKSADIILLPYTYAEVLRIPDYLDKYPDEREHLFSVEVKYRKDASGFKSIYREHLKHCGLRTEFDVTWDGGFCTGGFYALRSLYFELVINQRNFFTTDRDIGKSVRNILEGERGKSAPDFAAFRGSKQGWPFNWVFAWKSENEPSFKYARNSTARDIREEAS